MKVIIRADASVNIGTGHVIRCLTLAKRLKEKGHEVHFVCKTHPGNIITFVESMLFSVHEIPMTSFEDTNVAEPEGRFALGGSAQEDAFATIGIIQSKFESQVDWLIVDHYGLDEEWQTELRPFCKHIMVVDDLDNRPHNCDLLLDQNCTLDFDRYTKHAPEHCKKLLGPSFTLLRDEFSTAKRSYQASKPVKLERKVLVFFGGSDKYNETLKVLRGVLPSSEGVTFDVIVGKSNPHINLVTEYCQQFSNITVNVQVSDISRRMLEATLFIGAGGATSLERAYCGLPSIVSSIAQNQEESSYALAALGVHKYLGQAQLLTEEDYRVAFYDLLNDKQARLKMERASENVVDGLGVERVVNKITEITNESRI